MQEHWRSIGSKFSASAEVPDRLFGIRTEAERSIAIQKAEKISKRGQAGAAARWKDANNVLKHPLSIAR